MVLGLGLGLGLEFPIGFIVAEEFGFVVPGLVVVGFVVVGFVVVGFVVVGFVVVPVPEPGVVVVCAETTPVSAMAASNPAVTAVFPRMVVRVPDGTDKTRT